MTHLQIFLDQVQHVLQDTDILELQFIQMAAVTVQSGEVVLSQHGIAHLMHLMNKINILLEQMFQHLNVIHMLLLVLLLDTLLSQQFQYVLLLQHLLLPQHLPLPQLQHQLQHLHLRQLQERYLVLMQMETVDRHHVLTVTQDEAV
jgi:hypothetical protein